MKLKEIITLAVAGAVIIAAGIVVYIMLFPQKTDTSNTTQNNGSNNTVITGNISEETIKKLGTLKDYGAATLDNIGRVDPFGSLN